MPEPIKYSEVRQIARNGDGLFYEGNALQSKLIRWWTNDEPHPFWRWLSLAPYSHAELVTWDAVYCPDWHQRELTFTSNVRLCSWGSVEGGPRKIPLWRYVRTYNDAGGRVFYAPLRVGDREAIMERANRAWGSHYPNLRQWGRTALRNWFKDSIDSDPEGYTCWEFVAYCLGLDCPASWYGMEIGSCGLFGEAREIVLDGVE